MDIRRVAVEEFSTGSGVATSVAAPIVAEGQSPQAAFRGIRIRAIDPIYVGREGVTAANGYEIPAGAELFLPINDPSKVYVVATSGGSYSWCAI